MKQLSEETGGKGDHIGIHIDSSVMAGEKVIGSILARCYLWSQSKTDSSILIEEIKETY